MPKILHARLQNYANEELPDVQAGQDIFKMMKGKSLQPRILNPVRLSLRFDGKI